MNLGETIYRLRTEKNMSQGDLADALDVSRQSVSKWENGNATPDLDKLLKMSALFNITLDELVRGHGTQSVPQRESPQQDTPAVSSTAYPVRKIAGILLLVCGILCFFVPTFLGSILVGYLFGAPLAVIGAMLAFAQSDWMFRICWLLYALFVPMLSLFGYNFIRFDISSRLSIFLILSLAPLILWTVKKARSGKLTNGSKIIIMVSILLFLLCVIGFHMLFAGPPLETLNILHKNATSLL